MSGIYTYGVGTPVAVSSTNCTTTLTGTSPLQGPCSPNINPNFGSNRARINGGFGRDSSGRRTACALGACSGVAATKYFDANGFSNVPIVGGLQLLGNAPRTGALNLTNPASQNLDTSIRRTFLIHDKINVQVEVDCLNTFNHTNFGSPSAATNSAAFGTITTVSNSPRDFQLAGHFNF